MFFYKAKVQSNTSLPVEELDLNDKKTQLYIQHLYKDENFRQFTVRNDFIDKYSTTCIFYANSRSFGSTFDVGLIQFLQKDLEELVRKEPRIPGGTSAADPIMGFIE